jgi:ubiquinone/menaquinone biosynthesis C-methylase UbiE
MPEHKSASNERYVVRRFDYSRAARLDDPARFDDLPPDELVALVDAPPDAVVLDFGAGTGTYALAFAERRPDCTLVGLDNQPEMLELLRAKPGSDRIRTGGEELLDSLAGRVERVFSINVLHELEDGDLRALLALLAPGGRAVVIDWNADVERPSGPSRDHCYGPEAAAGFLEPLGFSIERTVLFRYQYAFVVENRS